MQIIEKRPSIHPVNRIEKAGQWGREMVFDHIIAEFKENTNPFCKNSTLHKGKALFLCKKTNEDSMAYFDFVP